MSPLSIAEGFMLWQNTLAAPSRRYYGADLRDLAQQLGVPTPLAAVEALVRAGPGGAFEAMQRLRASCLQRGLSVSTRNRRLAAARSIINFLGGLGLVSWKITLRPEKVVRDMRGKLLALETVAAMLEAASPRDRAMLWLLYAPALRANEVASLNVKDVDLARRLVYFTGKMRNNRESHDLPEGAVVALEAWLAVRGDKPGPLFLTRLGTRVDRKALFRTVRKLAERCGVPDVGPHHLRHTGITEAARQTHGDMPLCQEFARHSAAQVTLAYIHLAKDTRRATVDAVGGALTATMSKGGAPASTEA